MHVEPPLCRPTFFLFYALLIKKHWLFCAGARMPTKVPPLQGVRQAFRTPQALASIFHTAEVSG
jgi:hypothetical protein